VLRNKESDSVFRHALSGSKHKFFLRQCVL